MPSPRNSGFKNLSLDEQIEQARTELRTDKLDLTFSEFDSMYKEGELIITPDYQRLFRWDITQKSRFIESILLGIPTPAIFVAETETGIWELVDGLQRISTVLEFFGSLKDINNDQVRAASRLSLDDSSILPGLNSKTFNDLSLRSRLAIRRAGCRVEVVKVGSKKRMKYDLFERLNTGGAQLSEQEIRNCIFRAEVPDLMNFIDELAKSKVFKDSISLSDEKINSLYDRGLILRFFALKNYFTSFNHDVEPFITEYLYKISEKEIIFDMAEEETIFNRTIKAINEALGTDSWRHIRDNKHQGGFSPYIFEALTLAVAEHISQVESLDIERRKEIFEQIKTDSHLKNAMGPGANTKNKLSIRINRAKELISERLP